MFSLQKGRLNDRKVLEQSLNFRNKTDGKPRQRDQTRPGAAGGSDEQLRKQFHLKAGETGGRRAGGATA